MASFHTACSLSSRWEWATTKQSHQRCVDLLSISEIPCQDLEGRWKCLTDSFTLLSTEGNSSDFAHHCVTAAVCTWSWPWYLCHVRLGAEPGMMSFRSGLDDCVDFDAFSLLTWKNIFYSRTNITNGLPLWVGYSNVFVGIAMLNANDWGLKCWC